MTNKEEKILVIYIGVAGIRSEDIDTFTNKVASKITPSTFQGEIIIIPVQSFDTRIECINPQYVADSKLIQEHSELMKEINEHLKYQIDLLKMDDKNNTNNNLENNISNNKNNTNNISDNNE